MQVDMQIMIRILKSSPYRRLRYGAHSMQLLYLDVISIRQSLKRIYSIMACPPEMSLLKKMSVDWLRWRIPFDAALHGNRTLVEHLKGPALLEHGRPDATFIKTKSYYTFFDVYKLFLAVLVRVKHDAAMLHRRTMYNDDPRLYIHGALFNQANVMLSAVRTTMLACVDVARTTKKSRTLSRTGKDVRYQEYKTATIGRVVQRLAGFEREIKSVLRELETLITYRLSRQSANELRDETEKAHSIVKRLYNEVKIDHSRDMKRLRVGVLGTRSHRSRDASVEKHSSSDPSAAFL